jgi:hypothetical protein
MRSLQSRSRTTVSTRVKLLRWEVFVQMFVDGVLKAPHGKVFPLEQVADAVEESMRHGKGNKVLLEG